MTSTQTRYFDLNTETVLEHWSVAQAVREILANALDEHLLGWGTEPAVTRDHEGWRIRDFGRGLRPDHLTQNENPEKLASDSVIGRFGVGLKDALAVLARHGVQVQLSSRHATITTAVHPKSDFPDLETLHAVVQQATNDDMVGTEAAFHGLLDEQMYDAKSFFLRWNDETVLESTEYGSVIERAAGGPARVYVRGLRVAEEDSLLFSYDITKLNSKLSKALNRERANVGRTAYSERLKDILLASSNSVVMGALARDLSAYEEGEQHVEAGWVDIAVHAISVLNTREKVVFVTAVDLSDHPAMVEYARGDGHRIVIIPSNVARKLSNHTDASGAPVRTLDVFASLRAAEFIFAFVAEENLTSSERWLLQRAPDALVLAGVTRRWPILVTETMRPGQFGSDEVGLWDPTQQRIIVRRDQLQSSREFFGTLLHEVAHATSGWNDATLDFERALSDLLGDIASAVIGTERNG